jgi:hypothetical protein
MKVKLQEIPVQILNVNDDDILILRIDPEMDEEQRYYLRHALSSALLDAGKNNPVRCISKDVDLAVVKSEDAKS